MEDIDKFISNIERIERDMVDILLKPKHVIHLPSRNIGECDSDYKSRIKLWIDEYLSLEK